MSDEDIIDTDAPELVQADPPKQEPERPENHPEPSTALAERMKGVGISGGVVQFGSLADASDLAQLMAKGQQAVPPAFRRQPGMCLAVIFQAMQWRMNPFSLVQGAYVVNDRVAYEAKVLAAVIQANAPIVDVPSYTYDGQGDSRTCTVTFYLSAERTRTYTTPLLGKIHPKNSPLWKTDPDQQLAYFAVRAGARRYFPDIMLGAYDPEEVASIREANRPETSGLIDRIGGGGKAAGFSTNTVDEALTGK